MSVLGRKMWRDLARSKGMLAAIASVIAVGIGCLVCFQGVQRNLFLAKDAFYARCRLADFWIDLKKAPAQALENLRDLPGVAELRHRISFAVMVDMPEVEAPISGLLISMPSSPKPVLNGLVITSGSYFSDQGQDEVILSDAFAKARKIQVGDRVSLILDRRKKDLYVVGTAISAEFVYLTPPGSLAPEPESYGVFYVKREFAEEQLDFKGAANSLVGRLTPEYRKSPALILDEMELRLKPYGVLGTTTLAQQPSNLALSAEMEGLATLALFMPLIFLSVSALILNVLMRRMAEEQRTIVGTLKALGYRNTEILYHFLMFGGVVGMVGAVAGSILGYLSAWAMTSMYKEFFHFPRLVNAPYPVLFALSFGVSLVFGLMGTVRGVRTVSRLRPAEAMRHSPPATGGAIFLERFPGLWRRLGFRWQMVLRNLLRNKRRTLIGVFAAAMGSALVVSTLGTIDSMKYMLTFQFDKVLQADYTLTLRNAHSLDVVYEAGHLPSVIRVEPVLDVPATIFHRNRQKKISIQGVTRQATLTVPRDLEGRSVRVPAVGLLMAQRLAEQLDVAPGEMIRVVPSQGLQEPFEAPVAGVVDSMIGLSVFADFDYLNRRIHESAAVTSLQIRADQSPDLKDKFLQEVKKLPVLESVGDIQVQKRKMKTNFLDKMGQMTYPMTLFGAVIFFGSILNSSLIAIVERKREIAMFRVLGYHPREIGAVFLAENLVQNLIGAVLGLPLGFWMLKALAVQFSNDLYAMPYVILPSSYAWSMILAVCFIFGAQGIVQISINRLDWNEALKLKE